MTKTLSSALTKAGVSPAWTVCRKPTARYCCSRHYSNAGSRNA